MTDQTKNQAHVARNAALKAEGDLRRTAKKEAGLLRAAENVEKMKALKTERVATNVQAHNDRNASAKKPAKAA